MKKSKKTAVIFILLILAAGIIFWGGVVSAESPYRLEVVSTEGNGYGYKIYEGKRVLIYQPFVPAIGGKVSFRTEQDAQKVGSLVMERIKLGEECSISKTDLEQMGVSSRR